MIWWEHTICGLYVINMISLFCTFQIGHICDSQRRKMRHYQLMWVTLKILVSYSLYFTTYLIQLFHFYLFADCITDPIVICDDLLWYCQHCWRIQRHGRLLRAEKQVGFLRSSYPPALSVITLLSISSDKHMKRNVYDCSLPATAVHFHIWAHLCTRAHMNSPFTT